MDIIKQSYDDGNSTDDETSAVKTDGQSCEDYFGLEYNDMDKQLESSISREWFVLKDTASIFENAFKTESSILGPHKPSKLQHQNCFSDFLAVEAKTNGLKLDTQKCNDKVDEVGIYTEVLNPPTGKNIPWEEILQTRFRSDKWCTPPNRCITTQRLSEKALTRVQWNTSFANLLLSTSLDGCVRIWNYASCSPLSTLPIHPSGAKAGVWSLDGRKIFSGGFDKSAHLTDIVTGQQELSFTHKQPVSSVQVHPLDSNIFLSGSFNSILAWDVRSPPTAPISTFSSNCKQVLCIAFLPGGEEFVCSTEVVCRDSADRTIMTWHFGSRALFSNQIYQERFHCPWLCVDKEHDVFFAQSSGNYIAEFSTFQPYKMNKNRRYEAHNISGYGIGCCLSTDCKFLASGDTAGGVYIYQVGSGSLVRQLACQSPSPDPSISLDWHPQLGSLLAVGTWNGKLCFWGK